jgi:hypothetical protein
MKAKLLPLIVVIIIISFFCVRAGEAYTVTLQQFGSSPSNQRLVAQGGGVINLAGLTFDEGILSAMPFLAPRFAILISGRTAPVDAYTGIAGPTSFGTALSALASTSSGDLVGIAGAASAVYVPDGYVSGTPLRSFAVFNNTTLAGLGITPGTYVWTWGTGLRGQNLTLIIREVPDGGSTVFLLGFGLFGLAALRRKLNC